MHINEFVDPTTPLVIGVDAGQNLRLSGIISGPVAAAVEKVGLGTLELSGPNTYEGVTKVSQGVLDVRVGGLGSSVSETIVLSGATLRLNPSPTAGTFSTVEPLTLNGTAREIAGPW